MSIKLMAMIWDNGPDAQADCFVLLALADFANDDGECWPSVATVARKTRMKERGVRQILRRLEAAGWLETIVGGGRSGCNRYRINPAPHAPINAVKPGTTCPPAPHAPRHMNAETRHQTALNPAPHAPKPSRTTNNPAAQPRDAQVGMHLRVKIIEALGLTGGEMNTSGTFVVAGMTPGEVDMHFAAWRAAGLTDDQIIGAITAKVSAMRSADPAFLPRSLKFFDGPVRDFAARLSAKPKASTGPQGQQTERDRRMSFYRRVSGANP